MFSKHFKQAIIAIWIGVLAYAIYYLFANNLNLDNIVELLRTFLTNIKSLPLSNLILPLVFTSMFVGRPLLLIPTWVMNVAAYFVFGPLEGFIVVVLAEQLSSVALFLFVRYLAGEILKKKILTAAKKIRLDINSNEDKEFFTVLVLRMATLPFDFVTSLCALSGIKLRPFALGTFCVSVVWVALFFLTFRSFAKGSIQNAAFEIGIFLLLTGVGYLIAKKHNVIMSVKDLDQTKDKILT